MLCRMRKMENMDVQSCRGSEMRTVSGSLTTYRVVRRNQVGAREAE